MGKRAVVLVIALVLAGAAAFAIFQFLKNIENDILAAQEQFPVFRAVQAIPEGTEGSIVLQGATAWYVESFEQAEDLPADAIQTRDDLERVLRGKVAVGPVSQNEILTQSQWVELSVDITPLSEQIPEGKQALTISPGDVQGVNGFVEPGDLVNVIVTLDIEFDLTEVGQAPDFGIPTDTGAEGTTGEAPAEEKQVVAYTRYVLQGLEVLAVGRDVVVAEDAPVTVSDTGEVGSEAATATPAGEVQEAPTETPETSTVYTLSVDPAQAERLVFALQEGVIYLTLAPDDFVEVATSGVTINNLFEGNLVQDIFQN